MRCQVKHKQSLDQNRRKPVWKVLTFKMKVKSLEFSVLADALAGELYRSAQNIHGCGMGNPPIVRVNGKLIDVRRGMFAD